MTGSNKHLLSSLVLLQVVTVGLLFLLIFFPTRADHSYSPAAPAGVESDARTPHAVSAEVRHEAIALAEFRAVVRSVMRDELEAFADTLRDGAVPREAAVPAAPSANDIQGQEEAAAVSAAVVQQALSAGVWTAEDTRALLPHLGRLSEDQRIELVDRFYTAVNRQQLDMQDVPPF